jgi:DNA-binding LacI/PurR family transcriptional regulator
VAGDLGLSAMTVSRALNGHPDVKEETRRRVIARATELNYRPNRWARSLVTQRSRIVGAVIPKITYSFFGEIIGGLQDVLEQEGYSLILSNSSEDPERERREIDMLVGSRAEGLVVVCTNRGSMVTTPAASASSSSSYTGIRSMPIGDLPGASRM